MFFVVKKTSFIGRRLWVVKAFTAGRERQRWRREPNNLTRLNNGFMSTNHEINFTQIYAGNILEAGMVKSLLENAGIHVFLKDEIMGTFMPWWTSPGGAGAVKVMVPTPDQESVKLIVADYENNVKENQL